MKFLGVDNFEFYNLPCGRLDLIDIIEINKIIEKEIKLFRPNIIMTHNSDDCNNDHRIINRSVMMATRPIISNRFLKKLLLLLKLSQALNGTLKNQFNPNYFENLSDKNIKDKVKAFYFYKSEIQSNQIA